jgi:transcriptional regulator with XRE-family HTH domain
MKIFGTLISEARRSKGLSQKDLAAKVKKEDGQAISPQYLNDIEHDRRNPPGAPDSADSRIAERI